VSVSALVRRDRILVVEDNPTVAALLSDFLTAEGQDVETVPNGFVTGQALTLETREFISRVQVPILGKPFNLNTFREVAEEMLAARPSC
jgi:DNA-binding NtrC family response regulator